MSPISASARGLHPWYVLIETASGEPGSAEAAMERLLAKALEDGLVQDAAIAQSQVQSRAFWKLRESQSGAQKPEGAAWKHDVSVPVSKVADFIDQASAALTARWPGVRIVAFGHVGDGNVHYDVLAPNGGDQAAHAACAIRRPISCTIWWRRWPARSRRNTAWAQ